MWDWAAGTGLLKGVDGKGAGSRRKSSGKAVCPQLCPPWAEKKLNGWGDGNAPASKWGCSVEEGGSGDRC